METKKARKGAQKGGRRSGVVYWRKQRFIVLFWKAFQNS